MTGKNGFVYIFRRSDGLRKLGWTTSIRRRQYEHHLATGLVHDFELAWEMGDRAAHRVERKAHKLLSGLNCSWSREVYDLPLSPITDAVESAMLKANGELPKGLASCFPPRPRGPSCAIITWPDNWDEIVSAADAYLREHPDLQREIANYGDAVKTRLEYNS